MSQDQSTSTSISSELISLDTLEKLKSLKLSKLRSLALADPVIFIEKVMGTNLQSFHKKWIQFQINQKRSLLLAPRGFGKSTICTVFYCLWRLIRDPNLRIMIVSNTFSQAQSFMWEVRQQIETNETFREVFPEFRPGARWSDSELSLANKTKISKEANITAVGAQGAIVSKHVDVLIIDDLIDQENSRTETQRQKTKLWLSMTLMPTLEPEGEIHFLGTRYHADDLYGDLVRSEFKDYVMVDRALDDDDRSLWPKKFPEALLKSKRTEMGSVAFGMQYQNDVSGSEGDIFEYDWIKYYDEIPKELRIFQGVDLAIGQKNNHDYFAHCTVGIDPNSNIFVLDFYRGRHSFLEQVDVIVQKYNQFDPIRVGVETVAYQHALAHHLKTQTNVRVYKMVAKVDKVTRAQKLSAKFEAGKVYFQKHQQDLIEEVCRFPNGKHDDLFDALEFAIRLGADIVIRKKRANEPGLFGIESPRPSSDKFLQRLVGSLN